METVSANISYVLFHLAKNDQVQDNLFRQLWATFPNEQINMDDLYKCELLNNVIQGKVDIIKG